MMDDYRYESSDMKAIEYRKIALSEDWQRRDIRHEFTEKGIERFSADWNTLIERD